MKEPKTEKPCVCAHVCVCVFRGVQVGGPPTYLKRGMGAAICFSFRRRSVVFQQWQASEWKLALTSNYILPACQGLWDYRLTGLQSALSFLHSHFVIPSLPRVGLISAFSHSVVQLSFPHFFFPLDGNLFSIFNSPYSYHAISFIISLSLSPLLEPFPPLTLWLPRIVKGTPSLTAEEWNCFGRAKGERAHSTREKDINGPEALNEVWCKWGTGVREECRKTRVADIAFLSVL